MNNCMNCGAMLLEGAAVCPVCQQPTGSAQGAHGGANWQPQQPAVPPVAPWPQMPYTPPSASSNSGWLVAIGFLALMVIGGAAGIIFFVKSQRASRTNYNDNYNRVRAIPTPDDSDSTEPPAPPGTRTTNSSRAPISGGVLNSKAIVLPKPAYPAIARAARASGTVVVQVTVDEGGEVTSARAVSGHPLLQAAATQAARQAKFSPTMLAGKPVKVTGVLNYNFVPE